MRLETIACCGHRVTGRTDALDPATVDRLFEQLRAEECPTCRRQRHEGQQAQTLRRRAARRW